MQAAWLTQMYGPRFVAQGPKAMSRGEEVVYAELDRRGIDFVAHWRPFNGDIPFTPGRESREVDAMIPALELCIFVNSAFTHPSAEADALTFHLMGMLGMRSVAVWDYEIVPELGGNVRKRLAEVIPYFGVAVRRKDDASLKKKRFTQPPRILPFGNAGSGFGGF
jgi:hypothetical protein